MSRFSAEEVRWKQRRAIRLSNGEVEITVLMGGGHVADFRLCGSPINVLWESPWPTIEPSEFSEEQHIAIYGERVAGQMLSGYTGHALAIGYFGMPSQADASRGLALHGEAACSRWRVTYCQIGEHSATVTLEVSLPISQLHVTRTLSVDSRSTLVVSVTESVRNDSAAREVQWVEHAAFGEPLLAPGESTLSLSGDRAVTWPLGYEGHELLPNNLEFEWPNAGGFDLSEPFLKEGTGFVAAIRVDQREDAFAAVLNRRHSIAAGYVFDAQSFPWIALWEENRARSYPPWSGETRVRGVEFGTSPFPLGLEHAQQIGEMFGQPVLASIAAGGELTTSYQMFVTRTPAEWSSVRDVRRSGDALIVHSESGDELRL